MEDEQGGDAHMTSIGASEGKGARYESPYGVGIGNQDWGMRRGTQSCFQESLFHS